MEQLSLFDLEPFTLIPDYQLIGIKLTHELEERLEWLENYKKELDGQQG